MLSGLNPTQKGIFLAICGFSAFAVSDACAKWLSPAYPVFTIVGFIALFSVITGLVASPLLGGLQRTLEGSSLETIRHMVATGLGVTVLPSSAADELAAQNPLVAVRPFSDPQPSRRVALAWRVTYPRSGAIDVLRRAILDSELPGVKVVGRA